MYMKKVLFYSSVKTKKMFSIQSYYRNDILILKKLKCQVKLSNSIFDFFKFWDYDIGFFYFYRYSLFAALISKIFFKKNIFTGGIDYLDSSFASFRQRLIQALFFKICNLISDANVLVSTTDVSNVRKIYNGTLPEKCVLSFHVIDFDSFEYKNEKKEKIFTTIAWMVNRDNVYRKGVDKTIKAFALFVKLFPDYKLIIAGPSGAGGIEIINLISKLKLSKSVEYIGTISEKGKIDLLKSSMFYSQLSIYEGFGIAAIEALAAGNIIIHSGNGGLKDAIAGNGYITDISSIENVFNTFVKAVQENEKVDTLRKIGIQYVKDNFIFNRRLQDLDKVFLKIYGKKYWN